MGSRMGGLAVKGGKTWISISKIGCEANTINDYDSAYANSDLDTKMQICSFWRPMGDCDHQHGEHPNPA